MLTDPAFIRRLESLYLLTRKVLGGSLQADRRSTKKGSGVTFADYAEYTLGDDLRAIDWRVKARFESLVIKLFETEEDATIYLFLDCSQSMGRKLDYAKQLAAALGYIALNTHDEVVLYSMSDQLRTLLEPRRGRGKAMQFLQALEDATTTGSDSDFTACTREFRARHRRRGVVIVISDFFFPGGFEDGLSFLLWSKHDVFCMSVQDDDDTHCTWKGDVDLECVETGQTRRVTVSPREASLFETAVRDWNDSLATCCARRGIGLANTRPDVPFDRAIEEIVRRGGLIA